MKACLCIHGHFYQPPRENPWIEDIEPQESAAPFHDWNDRIHSECYLPNSRARVLGYSGKILDIVNNYTKMSFNFGPTLMSWLEAKHFDTYLRIIEADHESRKAHKGHGNAIAQVYNHMIMPLANRRDKVTQVRWGVREFVRRFGREPESIWLPETAVNEETLEVLVQEGIRFIILEPHQAEAFRSFGGEWTAAGSGEIDPRRAYRCFLKKDPEKFIDVFFYDGPISKAAGFENLLFDAKIFMDSIERAVTEADGPSQLIHLATDGETYGHHKAFGDRAAAYLTYVEAPARGYRVVNYGEYLAEHPPKHEVRLKDGENGLGTAWSCAHGVRRWSDHCGCRGGGPADWNQHWRRPLREALDWLRDELALLFEVHAAEILRDPWTAREDYIDVVLDRRSTNVLAFMERHRVRELSAADLTRALKLLEMQRHAMLMYTSCGWFFTELSGLETVQILQYAARALQLAEEVSGTDLEEAFLSRLEKAKSNVAALRDGRGVYEKLVKTAVATLDHIVSYYAMGSVLEDYYPQSESHDLYCFNLQVIYQRKETFGSLTVNFGRVKIVSKITLEEKDVLFIALQTGLYDFRCSVKTYEGPEEFEKLEQETFDSLYNCHIVEIFKRIDERFGDRHFTLKELLLQDRINIISRLTRRQIDSISKFYERVYEESRRINEVYGSILLPIPAEFRYAAEHVLSRRLLDELYKLAAAGFHRKATAAYRMMETAKAFNVEIRKGPVAQFLSAELAGRISRFVKNPEGPLITECIYIHKLSKKLGVDLDLRQPQEDLFHLIRHWCQGAGPVPDLLTDYGKHLSQLLTRLGLALQDFKQLNSKSAQS
ncbi:MAG: DUF3536 domain-containing protein [Candidatus Omnitrophica bacterium]|nr:DUF3536 domain-containing protein [Candidatus Omnitrophota bacterium]